MDYDFRYEHFDSVYDFERAINTRRTNPVFEDKESAFRKEEDFFGTEDYDEANRLLTKGWNTEIGKMKKELKSFSRTVKAVRVRHVKSVAGHAPCVPNAIRGVPKSMIAAKRDPAKKKERTAHLIFINDANYLTSSENLMKSGMTVLKLAAMLDKTGMRTRIDIAPIMAVCDKSCYGCTVKVKDYRQTFNLSKVAYPIGHVSFFRRHGFRYLETMPGEINKNMRSGHGSSRRKTCNIMQAYLRDAVKSEGAFVIDFGDCMNADFDCVKLATNIGLELKEV